MAESSPYQPRYQWRMTQLDAQDEPTETDWCGYDKGVYIGRIMKEHGGPTKGKWQWSGTRPAGFKGPVPVPLNGHKPTARLAIQMVEEYWDRVSR